MSGRLRKRSVVVLVVATIMFGAASANAVIVEEAGFTSEGTERSSFSGNVNSLALHIGIAGQELTIADSDGESGFNMSSRVVQAPDVNEDLFMPCEHAAAVSVADSNQCLDADLLRERGLALADFPPGSGAGPTIAVERLVDSGVAELVTVDSDNEVTDQLASSTVRGVLIPNLSGAEATCTGTDTDEVVTVPMPEALTSVIDGHLAFARCDTDVSGFPTLSQSTGEAVLDVTLNETVVGSVPAVNDAIDSVQGLVAAMPEAVSAPVNNSLEEIQTRLNAQPVVQVRVAPTLNTLDATAAGMRAESLAQGATIDVLPLSEPIALEPIGQLDGVLRIIVGEATTSAAVEDGTAVADNAASVVRVQALNILSEDPEDLLLDLEVPGDLLPNQDLTLLENTPLQSTIRVANAPEPTAACRQAGDARLCEARAEAQSLSISLFDNPLANGQANPLPNIRIDLASAGASVDAEMLPEIAQTSIPAEQLPRTGPISPATVLVGVGFIATGLLVRRRFGL